MRKKDFLLLLMMFLFWRATLFFIGHAAQFFLPYTPTVYSDTLLDLSFLPVWLYRWAQFDGVHYITIARHGYSGAALIQAFFPIYPFMVRLLSSVFHLHTIVAGLLLSNLAFFAAVLVLFQYTFERFSRAIAWKSVILLLTFPTAFFFGAVYGESLFLLLVVLSFYSARHRRWEIVSSFVVLATATRLVGIFLIPALAVDLFFQYHQITRKTPIHEVVKVFFQFLKKEALSIFYIGFGILGLGWYMVFLWRQYQDPFYFFHVQSQFGTGRQTHLISLPQVLWRQIKILATYTPYSWLYWSFVQEFILTLAVGIILVIATIHRRLKIKISELVFCFGAFLLPPLTGTISSMPRYILLCFPLYFFLAQMFHKRWQFAVFILISYLVLVLNTMLFIQGRWIA